MCILSWDITILIEFESEAKIISKMSVKRIIVDVDCGTDDILALLLFLHAENMGKVKIEAITCTMGNTSVDNVIKTVVRFLEACGRKDIPVYRGITNSFIKLREPIEPYFGEDGFGDLTYDSEPDMSVVKEKLSVHAIYDIVKAHPKEITLMCLAPLTNIALAAVMYDDFKDNVKDLWIMGGNYTAQGNITATAEWNFYVDPESAHAVFENMSCPITIFPWELGLINISFDWRFQNLVNPNNPGLELLNRADRSIFEDKVKFWRTWTPADAVLAAAFIYPEQVIIKTEEHHASVELHGFLTRGQVVIDHLKEKKKNSTFLKKIDVNAYKTIILEMVKG